MLKDTLVGTLWARILPLDRHGPVEEEPIWDHEADLRDLHAKIGELTVERDFWPQGSSGEPGEAPGDDPARPCQVQLEPSMPAASSESTLCVPPAQGRERGESSVDTPDRQAVPGVPFLRQPADGPSSLAGTRPSGSTPGAAPDAPDGATGHLGLTRDWWTSDKTRRRPRR